MFLNPKNLLKCFLLLFPLISIFLFITPKTFAEVRVQVENVNSQTWPSPGDQISTNFKIFNFTNDRIWVVGARVDYQPTAYLTPDYVDNAIGAWMDPNPNEDWSRYLERTNFGTVNIEGGGCTSGSVNIEARVRVLYMVGLLNFNVSSSPYFKDVNSIGAGLWGYVKKPDATTVNGATVTLSPADGSGGSYTTVTNGYYEFKHINCTSSHTLCATQGGWSGCVYNISSSNPNAFICNGEWRQIDITIYPPSTPTPTATPTPTGTPPPTPTGCPGMTCRYSEATGDCASGYRWVTGTGCTGDNCEGCTYVAGCSTTECIPINTPTPTPPGTTRCYNFKCTTAGNLICADKTGIYNSSDCTPTWCANNDDSIPDIGCVEGQTTCNYYESSACGGVPIPTPTRGPSCLGDERVAFTPSPQIRGQSVDVDVSSTRGYGNVDLKVITPNGSTSWASLRGVQRIGNRWHWYYRFTPTQNGVYRVQFMANNRTLTCAQADTCDNRDTMTFTPSNPQAGENAVIKVGSQVGYSWIDLHKTGAQVPETPVNPLPGYRYTWGFRDSNLAVGTHNYTFLINEDNPAHGNRSTAPNRNQVCKTGSVSVNVTNYSISGYIFKDSNGDGIRDINERCFNSDPNGNLYLYRGNVIQQKFTTSSTNTCSSPSYTFSNLANGTYTVAINQPSGWYPTTLVSRSVTVPPSQTNINFGLTDAVPWWQTRLGNVRAGGVGTTMGDLTDRIPSACTLPTCYPYVSLTQGTQGPGIVSYKGYLDPVNLTVSSRRWKVKDGFQGGGTAYSYDYVMERVRQTETTPSTFVPGSLPTTTGVYAAGTGLGSTVTIPPGAKWQVGNQAKIVVLINGNLAINREIEVDRGSFLAFFVKEDILIDPSIKEPAASVNTDLEGIFVADDSFKTGIVADAAGRLNLAGTVVVDADLNGTGQLLRQRNLGPQNSSYPAFYVSYRPDFLLSTPTILQTKTFRWQEVSP